MLIPTKTRKHEHANVPTVTPINGGARVTWPNGPQVHAELACGYARRRPPAGRGEVSHVELDSFMMMRRSLWKSFAFFMGFVNMSATLSAVRTKGTSSSKDSTMSRTKK